MGPNLTPLSREYAEGIVQTIQAAAYAVGSMIGEPVTVRFHHDFRVSVEFRGGLFVISASDSENPNAHPLVQFCQTEQECEYMTYLVSGIAETLWCVTPELWNMVVSYANTADKVHE